MTNAFSSGKHAFGFCDRCGFRVKLVSMKTERVRNKLTGLKVCSACFDPSHPQLELGTFTVSDPQALRDPRPDTALEASRELT
jgi:hypothetical protein